MCAENSFSQERNFFLFASDFSGFTRGDLPGHLRRPGWRWRWRRTRGGERWLPTGSRGRRGRKIPTKSFKWRLKFRKLNKISFYENKDFRKYLIKTVSKMPQADIYLEILSREGREESRELVSGELRLVESVFNGGISTFLKENLRIWVRCWIAYVLFEGLVPSTVVAGPLVSGGFDELDTVDGGHELVLGKRDGLLVLAKLGEPVEDVGLGHLFWRKL